MMDREKFINDFIKIEYIEEHKSFGYYPFMMYVKGKDEKTALVSLAVESVEDCYNFFFKYISEEAETIHMALDFPAMEDIETDFVLVYSGGIKKPMSYAIIPYDNKTGERGPMIEEAKVLDFINKDLEHVARKIARKMMLNALYNN